MNIKTNKRARLLYILLACFLLFGFLFLPFHHKTASADELIPNVRQDNDSCNYLYDLNRVTMFIGSSAQIDLDYPKPIYPSTAQYMYDNNLGAYFNKRAYGYYKDGDYRNNLPSFDIMFGAGADNISPVDKVFSLGKLSSYGDYFNVPLYKSNSYIPLTGKGVTSLKLEFNDFLIPVTANTWELEIRPFLIYLICDGDFELHTRSTYRYLYNTRSYDPDNPSAVSSLAKSDVMTYESWLNNRSDFIESSSGFQFLYEENYYIKTQGDFFYQCVTDFTIFIDVYAYDDDSTDGVEHSTNIRQVSFTNYSYVLSDEYTRFSLSSVLTDYGYSDIDDVDFTSWVGTAVGGFLDFEIFPGFSITALISIIIAIPLVITLLRYFAGG